jgi:uncharacterized membrane protein
MLSEAEKHLVRNIVADYSEKIVLSAILGESTETIHSHMTDFYLLFVGALTRAKRDGRNSAMNTTLN